MAFRYDLIFLRGVAERQTDGQRKKGRERGREKD